MSTKVKAQRSASAEAVAASTTAPVFTLSGPITTVPAYLTEKLDETTGELA